MTFDPNNPAGTGMVLTFDDEFGGLSVSDNGRANGTTWTDHLWYEPPGMIAASRLSVSNGVLDFAGSRDGFGLSSVNAAGEGFSQKFGYFEARMWFPAGNGTWPAFWLMSVAHATSGTAATELDIVEGQGSAPRGYFGTLHFDSSNTVGPDRQNHHNYIAAPAGTVLSEGWHRYGALWDPSASEITFYFDGQPVGTAAKYSNTDESAMFVVLGNAIGDMIGSNTGSPDAPVFLHVDYVRVYQFPSQNPAPVPPQPVSSPDGGGLFPAGYDGSGAGQAPEGDTNKGRSTELAPSGGHWPGLDAAMAGLALSLGGVGGGAETTLSGSTSATPNVHWASFGFDGPPDTGSVTDLVIGHSAVEWLQ